MKKKTKGKSFTDYCVATEYPGARTAENELFLSFNNDEDAIDFANWLADEGMRKFQKWLDNGRPVE